MLDLGRLGTFLIWVKGAQKWGLNMHGRCSDLERMDES